MLHPPPRLFKNGVKVFDRSPRPPPAAGKQFGFVGKKTFARISFHEKKTFGLLDENFFIPWPSIIWHVVNFVSTFVI